ncbi:LytR family transcriptional regulator, partial [Kitasatospora sp. NPDC056181]
MSDRRGPQDDWSTGQYPQQRQQQYDQYGQPVQGGGYEQPYEQYDQYGQPVQQPYGQDGYAGYPGQQG